jgi:hypothetical protein
MSFYVFMVVQMSMLVLMAEEGDRAFLRKLGLYLQVHMASLLRNEHR